MFIRRKINHSGSTTIAVIEKRKGKMNYLKIIGTSSDVPLHAEAHRGARLHLFRGVQSLQRIGADIAAQSSKSYSR